METHPTAPTPIPAPDGHAQSEATVRVCLVSLCGELFAIDLGSVREVFEVESITPVPKMPPAFAGVANVRGMIIPLVDLRPLLGFPVEPPGPKFVVVIRHQGQQVGILVDQMPEIRTVSREELQASPTTGSRAARPFITSLLRIENRVSGVVEVPSLLACVNS